MGKWQYPSTFLDTPTGVEPNPTMFFHFSNVSHTWNSFLARNMFLIRAWNWHILSCTSMQNPRNIIISKWELEHTNQFRTNRQALRAFKLYIIVAQDSLQLMYKYGNKHPSLSHFRCARSVRSASYEQRPSFCTSPSSAAIRGPQRPPIQQGFRFAALRSK